jgi:hypothetical protein
LSYDIKKVKKGLALIKLTGNAFHLDHSEYTSAEIIKIMSHVRWLVNSDGIVIGKEGERILNG